MRITEDKRKRNVMRAQLKECLQEQSLRRLKFNTSRLKVEFRKDDTIKMKP